MNTTPIPHTPGEWIGQKTSADQGLIYSDHTGKSVAVCYDVRDLPLISAAPDLLAALLEYKRLYGEVQPAGGWQGVYEQGNAALDKAKGSPC